MDYQKFSKSLKDNMGFPNDKTPDQIATAVTNAYNFACVGSCRTAFGSTLLTGDTKILKSFIKESFGTAKTYTKDKNVNWLKMANGFFKYWLNSKFTLLPAYPPAIAPNMSSPTPGVSLVTTLEPFDVADNGTIIERQIPNQLEFTAKDFPQRLRNAWKKTVWKDFVDYFYDALLAWHLSLSGVYHGLISSPTGPLPYVGMWASVLGGSRRRSFSEKSSQLVKQVPQGRGTYIKEMQRWEKYARGIYDHEEGIGLIWPKYSVLYLTDPEEKNLYGETLIIPESIYDKFKINENAIFSHNHPWKSTPDAIYTAGFSSEDIINAIDKNFAEVRIANIKYTYVLQRPNGGWSTYRTGISSKIKPDGTYNTEDIVISGPFAGELTKEYMDYRPKYKYSIKIREFSLKRKLTPQEDQDIFSETIHNQNVYLAKKYGWKYERIKISELKNKGYMINKESGYRGP